MNRASMTRVSVCVLVIAAIAACSSGESKSGVELQPASERTTATPRPTQAPTAPSADSPSAQDTPDSASGTGSLALNGRLLLRVGGGVAFLDLASGELTRLEMDRYRAGSVLALSADRTRAAYVAELDFAVMDLASGAIAGVQHGTGGFPQNFSLSPDGQYLAIATNSGNPGSSFGRTRLLTAYLGDLAASPPVKIIETRSPTFFQIAWTTDGRLLWDDVSDEPGWMVHTPTNDDATESQPISNDPVTVAAAPFSAVSPDGSRAAAIAFTNQPDACNDSTIALFEQPVALGDVPSEPTIIWSETAVAASSPAWADDDTLLYVKLGSCINWQDNPVRAIMRLDLDGDERTPQVVAGPLGNDGFPGDFSQQGGQFGHLFAVSPDGRYVAWIAGSDYFRSTRLEVTDLQTGETQTVYAAERPDSVEALQFVQEELVQQVVWLE